MTRNVHTRNGDKEPRMRSFFFASAFTLLVSFSILYVFDLVPENVPAPAHTVVAEAAEATKPLRIDPTPVVEQYAVPVRIVADSVDLDVSVSNPLSSSLAILDQALLSGAVRYPGSGTLADTGNMLIFGHSSFLPVVRNKAFQAFNGLKDLHQGDIVRVYSEHREYLYIVESVSHVNAFDTAIPLVVGEKRLTLSTCDTFGEKTDRYVVDARFVGSYPIEK